MTTPITPDLVLTVQTDRGELTLSMRMGLRAPAREDLRGLGPLRRVDQDGLVLVQLPEPFDDVILCDGEDCASSAWKIERLAQAFTFFYRSEGQA
jgi:hypothetical protein